MTEQFFEHCDSRGIEIRVDREAGMIQGVKILGLKSRNGRTYPAPTLARSAPLYEGARVNVNHPRGGSESLRGYEDRIGMVRNVQSRSDGLYGDFYFNPKHRLAEQLVWDAEHEPGNVGFSHNVTARTSRQGKETVVEEIMRVQSVDLVADPATTSGLFESEDGATAAGANPLDSQVWDNPSQSWVSWERGKSSGATILQESDSVDFQVLQEEVRRLKEENGLLQRQLDAFKAEKSEAARRSEVDRVIEAAQLPVALVNEKFRELCYQSQSGEELARIVDARKEDSQILEGSSRQPVSVEQNRDLVLGGNVTDAASFASAIR